MAEIRPRIAAADAAGAIRIDGPLVFGVTRVLDEHAAFAGVEAGMTCGASGQHAIHHVNVKRDVIGGLFGADNVHVIARAVYRMEDGDVVGLGSSLLVDLVNVDAVEGRYG